MGCFQCTWTTLWAEGDGALPNACRNVTGCMSCLTTTAYQKWSWTQPVLTWALRRFRTLFLQLTVFNELHVFCCVSSLDFKPTEAVVAKSVLASIASSTVMVHLSTVYINFPHSFKFNSLIISLTDLLLLSGNGNVSSGAISAREALLSIPNQSNRLERML